MFGLFLLLMMELPFSCKGLSSDRPCLTLATLKQRSPVRKGPEHWQTLPETHGSSTTQPSCKGPLWRPI
ncbi:hypothetical protein QQF64_031346 [Cirrhinus molitorella]|uniref:Uncharacterized protein n=1 Tax=Cirrhinus molitorella TaxID=172907 RepID=A0ABR3MWQ1_9TELE